MMKALRDREKGSKIFVPNWQCIPMNNDQSHLRLVNEKIEEAKHVQERKQIDRMLQAIVKERMFGSILSEERHLSSQTYLQLKKICADNLGYSTQSVQVSPESNHKHSRQSLKNRLGSLVQETKNGDQSPNPQHSRFRLRPVRPIKAAHRRLSVLEPMIDTYKEVNIHSRLINNPRKRSLNVSKSVTPRSLDLAQQQKNKQMSSQHLKQLQIDDKKFGEMFRRLANNFTQIIYDIKITRETLCNKYKNSLDPKILQQFFHFFNFPATMGYKQYCNLLENAANCSLRYIYFFAFSLVDESGNGSIEYCELFHLLLRFYVDSTYLHEEVYRIAQQIKTINSRKEQAIKEGKELPKDTEPMLDQVFVINHALKMDDLKQLFKQTHKERIAANCVKSTCYHQTVLSLQHHQYQRMKQDQLDDTEVLTKKSKSMQEDTQVTSIETQGIRLKEFTAIMNNRRPKIFCLFIKLLTGENAEDYE